MKRLVILLLLLAFVNDQNGNWINFPSIWNGPDAPSAIPNALDDEFDDSVLSSSWNWTNQGSCTTALGNSWLGITCPGHGGTHILRFLYKAAPATPWEFETKISWYSASIASATYGGLVTTESSTGKSVASLIGGNGGNPWLFAEAANFTNLTTVGTGTVAFTSPLIFYSKIKNDGTTVTVYWSPDGANWRSVQTYNVATVFTTAPDRIGIVVDDAQAATVTIGFEFFRRTL